jgi:hypothetical protein
MNRIVLIGNGFDLAHGLNTSYGHFIYWYLDQCGYELVRASRREVSDGLCSFKMKGDFGIANWATAFQGYYFQKETLAPWKGFDAFLRAIEDKEFCNFSFTSKLLQRIWKQISLGWVDIEKEYFSLLKEEKLTMKGEVERPNYKELNEHLEILRDKLIEYLESESEKECPFIDKIKDIIYSPIKGREISVSFKRELKKRVIADVEPCRTMFLNFNYTKTAEQYVSPSSNVVVNYIHGNLDNPESVIFGYGDELDSSFKKLQDLNDKECLRHMKSIRYQEADNYRKMLEFIESNPFQVIILGHSCGNSDRTLLNTLFEHKNCVSIKPYYYIKEDGTDSYLEMIQNISRNFTDMKLMRDRVVNKTYCETIT